MFFKKSIYSNILYIYIYVIEVSPEFKQTLFVYEETAMFP